MVGVYVSRPHQSSLKELRASIPASLKLAPEPAADVVTAVDAAVMNVCTSIYSYYIPSNRSVVITSVITDAIALHSSKLPIY
jgi:hypothetical protein